MDDLLIDDLLRWVLRLAVFALQVAFWFLVVAATAAFWLLVLAVRGVVWAATHPAVAVGLAAGGLLVWASLAVAS